jgi:diacylglycerol kinase family enzyme
MTADPMPETLAPARRAAALAALVLAAGALLAAALAFGGNPLRTLVAPVLVLGALASAWIAATRTRVLRIVGIAAAIGCLVGVFVLVRRGDDLLQLVALAAVLVAASSLLGRYALHRDQATLRALATPGTPVAAARQPVLIMNMKSGGGKAEQFDLVGECGRRGIEAVVLQPGDDLLELARDAIERGADVVGMAGGDGSQALVASVAREHDVAHVCIPAGTRNHFALDLGLDRDDVVGSLDAFGPAVERRIDLATVNGRVFVNNVSLGVYAKIVQSPEYRDAKRQTTASMLPELLGPDAEPFDLHFDGPDGQRVDGAQVIMVSNNPYELTSLDAFGTRARIDTGELGIAAAKIEGAADVAALVAAQTANQLERVRSMVHWSAPRFEVSSASPVEAGVDGEALVLDPPLVFEAEPGVLRVRIPHDAPGYSPAALKAPSIWWSLQALARAAAGHSTPIEESLR